MELIDSSYADSYSESEVIRCINVGLICVQEKNRRQTYNAISGDDVE